jgi:hypothetical protein
MCVKCRVYEKEWWNWWKMKMGNSYRMQVWIWGSQMEKRLLLFIIINSLLSSLTNGKRFHFQGRRCQDRTEFWFIQKLFFNWVSIVSFVCYFVKECLFFLLAFILKWSFHRRKRWLIFVGEFAGHIRWILPSQSNFLHTY